MTANRAGTNRIAVAAVTLALVVAGCTTDDDPDGARIGGDTVASDSAATDTPATDPPATGTPVTDGGTPQTPTPAPQPTDVEPGPRVVVLVESDDVLNVRAGAGTGNEIVATLAPGAETTITGSRATAGGSTWYEVETADGTGWVNGRFLGASLPDDAFAADGRVLDLVERFVAVLRDRGDLTPVTSERGLYVSYFDELELFAPGVLDDVLRDPTRLAWLGPAGGDPVDLTFAEAVADSIIGVWDDADRSVALDQPLSGPNSTRPGAEIPFTLRGFHFVSILDPGDDPQFDGLDWTSWHISIDYEGDEPVVVGLTIDVWSP